MPSEKHTLSSLHWPEEGKQGDCHLLVDLFGVFYGMLRLSVLCVCKGAGHWLETY